MIPSRIEINFILSILNFIDRWALNFSEDDDGGNRGSLAHSSLM